MVESGVDLAEGGLDFARVAGRAAWGSVRRQRDEGSEQAGAQLDEQHSKLEAARRQAVAPAGAGALHQSVRPELAQVVAQLAEPVADQQARVALAAGPVGQEGAWVEQGFEQPDHLVVLQLEPRHAAGADLHRTR